MRTTPLSGKQLIYDLDLDTLTHTIKSWGEPSYRGRQIWQGLYKNLWATPDQFTNLSLKLRKKLNEKFIFSNIQSSLTLNSSDSKTQKSLLHLPDTQAIEAVLMLYSRRRTVCISTQVGCGMGCVFCATGQMGFRRNLSSGEIVEQVLYFSRRLQPLGEKITNVVFMGMGEPFHNYDETFKAISLLNHPDGFNLGSRRFTISTVGLIPEIRRFTSEHRQVNLAVSLHTVNDELRSSMLPINKKYPVNELLNACRDYVENTNRRITFEWALIHNVNDSVSDARQLANRVNDILCHVNVIPLNPTGQYSGQATTRERAEKFKKELERYGISCTIRLRRGNDIQAGCGQLAVKN